MRRRVNTHWIRLHVLVLPQKSEVLAGMSSAFRVRLATELAQLGVSVFDPTMLVKTGELLRTFKNFIRKTWKWLTSHWAPI